MKQFLMCDTADHAAAVDHLVMEHLRETEGARGSSWSGVYTDGSRFGVLWAGPVALVFGSPQSVDNPSGDPSLQIVTESLDGAGVSDWQPVPEPVANENP